MPASVSNQPLKWVALSDCMISRRCAGQASPSTENRPLAPISLNTGWMRLPREKPPGRSRLTCCASSTSSKTTTG